MIRICPLLILYLVSGCKSETRTENSATTTDSSVQPVTEIYESIDTSASPVMVADEIFQFENEEIGSYPFTKEFQDIIASLRVSQIEKKPYKNLHDSTQTDTLMIVTFGLSTIEYYKVQSTGSGFILEAKIQSNEAEMKKGIRIGMTRKEFFSLFSELTEKPALKSVIISTMEGLNQCEFLFANDTLSQVTYQSYFD